MPPQHIPVSISVWMVVMVHSKKLVSWMWNQFPYVLSSVAFQQCYWNPLEKSWETPISLPILTSFSFPPGRLDLRFLVRDQEHSCVSFQSMDWMLYKESKHVLITPQSSSWWRTNSPPQTVQSGRAHDTRQWTDEAGSSSWLVTCPHSPGERVDCKPYRATPGCILRAEWTSRGCRKQAL